MDPPPDPKPSQDKVQVYRDRMRRQGLRPIQIWAPDVRSPAFEAEAHRQSLAVAEGELERQNQAVIDDISVEL